jgi:hypothetical protein
MRCRHCGHGVVCRPRGLCWSCYYAPGVRDIYPITHKFAQRGQPDFNGPVVLPAPTHALPGTLEKVAVLEQRASLRQALWNPRDAPYRR